VFAKDDSGTLKGSVRSIPGLHIRDALDAVATQNPGLITKFGGHAMAAGLSLEESQFDQFQQALEQQVENVIDPQDLEATLQTDGQLDVHDFSMHTAAILRDAGPWGQSFPEPCFEGEFELRSQRIVGENHLKVTLSPDAGKAVVIDGIYFNIDSQIWPSTATKARCVYRLDINEFRGRENLQLLIQYMEPI
jgi:single-stranded-DNA-specific exonuclease